MLDPLEDTGHWTVLKSPESRHFGSDQESKLSVRSVRQSKGKYSAVEVQ